MNHDDAPSASPMTHLNREDALAVFSVWLTNYFPDVPRKSSGAAAVELQLLAVRMRRRREELGLSKIDAATLAGIGRKTWTEIEAGQRQTIQTDTRRRILRVLDLDIEERRGAPVEHDLPGAGKNTSTLRVLGPAEDALRNLVVHGLLESQLAAQIEKLRAEVAGLAERLDNVIGILLEDSERSRTTFAQLLGEALERLDRGNGGVEGVPVDH